MQNTHVRSEKAATTSPALEALAKIALLPALSCAEKDPFLALELLTRARFDEPN